MIKLLSGYCPGYWQAFEATGSDAMMNWDWPEKLRWLSGRAVWPMIINNEGSLWRFKDWVEGHEYGHVLWHNEPPIPNPGVAVAMAEWTNAKRGELIAGGYMSEDCVSIVGNFLILPGDYANYASEINWFMNALDFDAILGVHLYHDHVESPGAAAIWHDEQLYRIRQDNDRFALTEWGDLSALWRSGTGPDIPAYSEYMWDCWNAQQAYDCYASAWYVGCASSDAFKNADYVLTNQDGSLRPLGEVWRDLPTGTTIKPEPPKPIWVTLWSNADYRLQQREAEDE